MMNVFFALVFFLLILTPAASGQEGTTYLSFDWYNDFFYLPAPTDHYFSNGLSFEMGCPGLAANPLNRLLIRGKEGYRRQYGLQLVQNLYTPVAKDTTAFMPGDRPFASYLTLSSVAQVTHPSRRLKWHSGFQLGVLGRLAGGRQTQNFVHSLTPNSDLVAGWHQEVRPDIVINYNAGIEKGIRNTPFYNINLRLNGRLGTLYTDLTPGVYLEAGRLDPFFATPLAWNKDRRLKFRAFGSANLRLVGYDATLSGGVFNRDERLRGRFPVKRIQPFWEAGVALSWRSCSLTFGVVGRAPEFTGGLPHRYGFLSFRFIR